MIWVVFNQKRLKIGCFGLKSTKIWQIRHIQIQIYPQTFIKPKYDAIYLKNKVSAHGLVLLVQLS